MGRPSKHENINSTEVLTDNSSSDTIQNSKARKLLKRRKRVPLVEQNRLMSFQRDDDYVYRLVNDTGDRIERFRKAGYEIVDKNNQEIELDSRVQDPSWRHSALSQPVGEGIIAYCMRIPREWWEEDQKAKQKLIKESEDNMRRPSIKGVSQNRTYGEIKIDESYRPLDNDR